MRPFRASLFSAVPLIAAVYTSTLSAQSLHIGVLGGAAWSTMKGEEAAIDLESTTGLMAGLSFVSSKPTQRLGLELDALYVNKGFKSTGEGSSFSVNGGFLEFPILLRVHFAQASKAQPFLAIGPSFGVNLSCSIDIKTSVASSSESCEDLGNGEFELKSAAVSGVVGGGIDFPTSKAIITTGVRYSRGFTSATGDDNHFNVVGLYLGLSRSKR